MSDLDPSCLPTSDHLGVYPEARLVYNKVNPIFHHWSLVTASLG